MPEPTQQPPSEAVNENTGIANADPNDFLAEGEGQGEQHDGEATPTNTSEQDENKNPDDGEGSKTPEEGAETTSPDDGSSGATKKDDKSNGDTVLYAGKFKTVEDLKKAYSELGGDPSRFSNTDKLAEAYLVRQSEFSRSRNDLAHKTETPPDDGTQPTEDQKLAEELADSIDYSKVKDAKDAVRETLKAAVQLIKKYQVPMDPKALVEKLAPEIADREDKLKQLTALEGKVPRLKTDLFFRKNFAYFVRDQQGEGTFVNIQESMKTFLNNYSSIVEEANSISEQNKSQKKSAAAPSDNGEGTRTTPGEQDEVDAILGAHQKKTKLYG